MNNEKINEKNNEKINEKMGQFILKLRKSKQMTQKELAEKLNITDKAVSKWERGISCPDISLLSSIAEVLGITTGELLNGKKSDCTEDVAVSIDSALHYADKTAKSKERSLQNICAISFSALLLIGVIVCGICDIAISGTFTWSLFPISSSIFAWLAFFPIVKYGAKGICGSLISCSVFIIPFLFVLNHLIKGDLILPIGIRMSVISIVYLWSVFALFKIIKERKLLAGTISLLLAIPVCTFINFSLSKIFSEPLIDVWDIVNFSVLLAAAIVLFVIDYTVRKKQS